MCTSIRQNQSRRKPGRHNGSGINFSEISPGQLSEGSPEPSHIEILEAPRGTGQLAGSSCIGKSEHSLSVYEQLVTYLWSSCFGGNLNEIKVGHLTTHLRRLRTIRLAPPFVFALKRQRNPNFSCSV